MRVARGGETSTQTKSLYLSIISGYLFGGCLLTSSSFSQKFHTIAIVLFSAPFGVCLNTPKIYQGSYHYFSTKIQLLAPNILSVENYVLPW